jgi:hypothetical protein
MYLQDASHKHPYKEFSTNSKTLKHSRRDLLSCVACSILHHQTDEPRSPFIYLMRRTLPACPARSCTVSWPLQLGHAMLHSQRSLDLLLLGQHLPCEPSTKTCPTWTLVLTYMHWPACLLPDQVTAPTYSTWSNCACSTTRMHV